MALRLSEGLGISALAAVVGSNCRQGFSERRCNAEGGLAFVLPGPFSEVARLPTNVEQRRVHRCQRLPNVCVDRVYAQVDHVYA